MTLKTIEELVIRRTTMTRLGRILAIGALVAAPVAVTAIPTHSADAQVYVSPYYGYGYGYACNPYYDPYDCGGYYGYGYGYPYAAYPYAGWGGWYGGYGGYGWGHGWARGGWGHRGFAGSGFARAHGGLRGGRGGHGGGHFHH
jgi:hypothetical protein